MIWSIGVRRFPKSLIVLLVISVGLLAAGCTRGGDCGWSGTIETFLDTNADGKHDQDDLPLAGVKYRVFVDGDSHNSIKTDSSGKAAMAFFVDCDHQRDIAVWAEAPERYSQTTRELIDAGYTSGQTFAFGFAPKR